MTVAELITVLESLPQTSEVILQRDVEGNGYSPLYAVDGECIYIPETTWSGDVLSTGWTAAEACMGEDEWEQKKAYNPRCVVLVPVA